MLCTFNEIEVYLFFLVDMTGSLNVLVNTFNQSSQLEVDYKKINDLCGKILQKNNCGKTF